MGALEGKVAVITGGNSGIGLAAAQRFVREGAYVFITGRRQAELDKAVSLIGKNVTAVQGDVSKLEDLDRLYEIVKREKGKVDVLFANAGVIEPASLAGSTAETYDKQFNLNARGVYFTVQKALPLLAGKASIILSGSAAWQLGVPDFGAYSATKAALVSFVRTWTAELAGRGIRANVISPGPTETPMVHIGASTSDEGTTDYFKKMIPMGRLGTPEEIASAAVFLASEESSFITGIDLPVDGGTTSR
ncbi:SDR family NAD(P)-dependent oxidoreductase [Silvibacterium dinghuense]|uniref:SDR family oxidoreductase n=1 Tax=Silvibacterium dinghuense TaxID=1560006 RepID=A0A4Q1SB31_9BACT|nr:SDR family oxidoreductase [Silvibacterium dinghuense]RXS94326.1 SDR family oxidoreductase [Silvibacterium dinghuense]GGH16890.1 oxidoreductase [Silvibacterium dinghuense]